MRRILLTIPESAMPRSKPSNNVQALHNVLLDIYPHRWHVSVTFNENKIKKDQRKCGSETHAEPFVWP